MKMKAKQKEIGSQDMVKNTSMRQTPHTVNQGNHTDAEVTVYNLQVLTCLFKKYPFHCHNSSYIYLKQASHETDITSLRIKAENKVSMKTLFGLIMFCGLTKVSRASCALQTEYFCTIFPVDYPENVKSILFIVSNVGVINSTVFTSPNLKSVTSLTLANSGIKSIESGAFRTLRGLTKLGLYGNHLNLLTPSWFHDPAQLENLNISFNRFDEIQPQMLAGFTGLTGLNFTGNNINKIGSGSLRNLSKLTFLDLSYNNISFIRRDVFSPVPNATVRLGDNPWNCSCELEDFSVFLQELINASQLADAAAVRCHSPLDLKGAHVWNVSYHNCSPAVISTPPANMFQKVGLPAVLVVLVIVLFTSLLFLLWKKKQDKKQVTPDTERAEMKDVRDTGGHPTSGTVAMMSIKVESFNKGDLKNNSITLKSNIPSVGRAKSASAVLLKADFLQTNATHCKKRAEQQHTCKSKDMRNDDGYIPSDVSDSNMELWYYNSLQSSDDKHSSTSPSVPVSGAPTGDLIQNPADINHSMLERVRIASQIHPIAKRLVEGVCSDYNSFQRGDNNSSTSCSVRVSGAHIADIIQNPADINHSMLERVHIASQIYPIAKYSVEGVCSDYNNFQRGDNNSSTSCSVRVSGAHIGDIIQNPADINHSMLERVHIASQIYPIAKHSVEGVCSDYNSLQRGDNNSSTSCSVRVSGAYTQGIIENPAGLNPSLVEGVHIASQTSPIAKCSKHSVDVCSHLASTDTNTENFEPLVYLSVNTAAEEPILTSSVDEAVGQINGNLKPRTLRRTFTWPKEKIQSNQDSSALYEDFLKTLNLYPNPGATFTANKKTKDESFQDWDFGHHLTMCNTLTEKKLSADKSGLKESPPDHTFVKQNKGGSKSQEGVRRNMSSTRKVYQRSMNNNRRQRNPIASPETGVQREDLHSQDSVGSFNQRTTPDDDKLLENNEYNFIDLLHEVVENHGRWTRERWRQTHHQRIPNRSSPQS
ncbi:uncharacterized protein LOC142472435 [Ascaphus truei]|uniref:uncharacterized protein LOC142472435 n=1 Tax=Ascaphus truei TaxID=8439 RepID=UPI003F59C4CD